MSFPVSKSRNKRLRKTRCSGEVKAFRPQITSLVDAMTIILIYLIQSFSSEGDIVPISKNLILPESTAKKKPERALTITVNNDMIMAENQFVANAATVLKSDELIIPQLHAWLLSRRETTEKIAQYSTTVTFKGTVMIMGDKRIRFELLKKIMYTCGQQQYNNFSLAVLQKGE
jgi:biopolymer transport protein ExbD